jgi:2-keto-4-pentenoate hydratase
MIEASPVEKISEELISLLDTEQQVIPFSRRHRNFGLTDAYKIVSRVGALRLGRGEKPIGRKIGFTNRAIWADLGISAPVWNYVFDTTVRQAEFGRAEFKLSGMPEPRIEPEIVVHLSAPPVPGMPMADLVQCIDWVAPGFEVVYSIFPNWDFTAADAAAAFGVHGALVVGTKLDLTDERAARMVELSNFSVTLQNDKAVRRAGNAANVLGGPVEALQFLVEDLARYPESAPLRGGELITTGTLTEAMPARVGETWVAKFDGIALGPLQLRFC